MRYVVTIFNVIGLAFACFTLAGRFFVPTPIGAALLGTVLTFLPFSVALFAYQNPQSNTLRRAAVVANVLGVVVVLALIFVAFRSGVETAPKIAVLLTLVGFAPCLVNVIFFVWTKPVPKLAANTSLERTREG